MRVLIAEDERRLADTLADGLRTRGLAVDVAHDGEQALFKARVYPYDVIVLDRDSPASTATRCAAPSTPSSRAPRSSC